MSVLDALVTATRNPAKILRYKTLLAPFARRVIGLDEVGVLAKAEEHGETSEENARIKARFYARHAGLPVFSDDASLYVDFLPPHQQPGVHVRRINTIDEASDAELLAYWETIVAAAAPEKRTGRWHVAFCLAYPDGPEHIHLLDLPLAFYSPTSPCRTTGWPLNSLSGPLEFNRPYCELTGDEENQANQHVDRAVTQMFAGLKTSHAV